MLFILLEYDVSLTFSCEFIIVTCVIWHRSLVAHWVSSAFANYVGDLLLPNSEGAFPRLIFRFKGWSRRHLQRALQAPFKPLEERHASGDVSVKILLR